MPLFAEDVSLGSAGLLALLASGITAAGTALVTILATVHKNRKETRADALAEYQALVERLQKELDAHTAAMAIVQARLTDCEVDRAELRGELKLQATLIRRLQVRTGDEAPTTVLPAVVVADSQGIIMLASPAITPMLHWLPSELRGKNIEVIIPERYRTAHRISFTNAALHTEPPWPDRSIIGHALTKYGQEVPVYISLSGWRTHNGDWQISAETRLRSLQGLNQDSYQMPADLMTPPLPTNGGSTTTLAPRQPGEVQQP